MFSARFPLELVIVVARVVFGLVVAAEHTVMHGQFRTRYAAHFPHNGGSRAQHVRPAATGRHRP